VSRRQVTEIAPAKVNLRLKIVGRRADGYHLIDSLIIPVSLADRITIAVSPARGRPQIQLRVRGATRGVPRNHRNLALRAARAFVAAAGVRESIAITLDKVIPPASGLGGGSSDAAAVLRALQRLHPGRLRRRDVGALALGLGADVPFFLRCLPARVSGIGEKVRTVRRILPRWFVIAVPRRGMSTAEAYQRFRLTTQREKRKVSRFRYGVSYPRNDLEEAVLPSRPDIGRLKQRLLEAGAVTALMSGSGSAVFGTFDRRSRACAAAARLAGDVAVFVVRPLLKAPA
jgi:4-diphosphocytidyl-2-C-methyl-D-erythritol kinase